CFVTDYGSRMFLRRNMLDLYRAGKREVVGVINLHAGLDERLAVCNELKTERAIRQFSEPAAEVFIDRPRVYGSAARADKVLHFPEVTVEEHADLQVIQHPAEQCREPSRRGNLKAVVHIAIIPVEAHGDAAAHLRLQLGRM